MTATLLGTPDPDDSDDSDGWAAYWTARGVPTTTTTAGFGTWTVLAGRPRRVVDHPLPELDPHDLGDHVCSEDCPGWDWA